jgi:poly(beta-D-mannuronate) lyase
MTGIAVRNHAYYQWGIDRGRDALTQQVKDDGSLPLEMKRGPRALQYHLMAVTPLVLLAEAGLRNGDDLYAVNDGALHRLVRLILISLEDSSYFRKESGFDQIAANTLHSSYFGWMEVYNARFPDKAVSKWLENYRPVFMRRTGGDMTYLYQAGVPKAQ